MKVPEIDHVIQRLADHPRCSVVWRDPAEQIAAPGYHVYYFSSGPQPPKPGVKLPPDMLRFRERISSAGVFSRSVAEGGGDSDRNGWDMRSTAHWGARTLTEELYHFEPGTAWDQLAGCYPFARCAQDGAYRLAVDLRPDHYGHIVAFFVDHMSLGSKIPTVALSFTEWLVRTMEAGPDARDSYWFLPGFTRYGEAPVE